MGERPQRYRRTTQIRYLDRHPASPRPEKPGVEVRTVSFKYEVFSSEKLLPEDEQELLRIAREVKDKAYARYSRHPVGAAVLCADGSKFKGNNRENAVSGATICAEVNAITTAGSEEKGDQIRKIAVVGPGDEISPCGNCRQVVKEHQDLGGHPIVILLGGSNGRVKRYESIDPLLPDGFGPKNLEELPK